MTAHACPKNEAAAPEAEAASAAAPGGPAKALRAPRMADPKAVVKTATTAFNPFRGHLLTKTIAGIVAGFLWSDFPGLTYEEIESLVYPKIVRGQLITDDLIRDRAAQIATVVCS